MGHNHRVTAIVATTIPLSISLSINPSRSLKKQKEVDNMKVFILLVTLIHLQLVWSEKFTRTALKFKDARSYIASGIVYLDDMEEALSICSWVRRMSDHRGIYQYWVDYLPLHQNDFDSAMYMSDSAYSLLLGVSLRLNTQPRPIVGSWNHMCQTFSNSTRTRRVFYNGEMIGEESTPSGLSFARIGSLIFGNRRNIYGNPSTSAYFGGELYDTKFLSKELSADTIRQLYNEGRCSDYSQLFADYTVLGWEDILNYPLRFGNVTEVQFECENDDPTEEATEEVTEEVTEEATEESTEDSGFWDFLRDEEFYNRLISEEMVSRLDLLEEFLGHRIDDALIEHLVKHHSDTT